MAQGDIQVTVIGNLTADPELRFTPSGAAVANFTIANNPRVYDKQTNGWKDGDPVFLRCNIWRQPAENVAETLVRGNRVIVTGRLRQRSFETREGEKRTVMELEVDEIGASLRFATAKINKVGRSSAPDGRSDDPWGSGTSGGSDDPWGSAPATAGAAAGSDDPPF